MKARVFVTLKKSVFDPQGKTIADADVMKALTPAEIDRAFDLHDQLRNVDAIIDRVFAAAAVHSA